jgi:hypothetical protein
MEGWELLGSSSAVSLSKAVLTALAFPHPPLLAYKAYLANTVSFTVSHKTVSLLDKGGLEEFYVEDEPLIEPKYLDVFTGRDLAKLEDCLNRRAIVYVKHGLGSASELVAHDYRVLDLAFPPSSPRKPPVILCLVKVGRAGRDWDLYQLPSSSPVSNGAELYYSRRLIKSDGCLVDSLSSLLASRIEHEHGSWCRELGLLLARGEEWCRQTDFVLVCHLRSQPRARPRNMRDPKNNVFGMLAVYNSGNSPILSLPVVSVTGDKSLCLLEQRYADSVLKVEARIRNPKSQPFPPPADALSYREPAAAKEKPKVACPCSPCQESLRFLAGMSANGPQTLVKTRLSLFDLLRLLGKLDAQTEALVRRACSLSVGAFDVESVATPISLAGDEDLAFPPGETSELHTPIPRRIHAVHEPVLIGFQDKLMLDREKKPLIFGHSDEARPRGLEEDFLAALRHARDTAVREKYKLLSGLLEWVEHYKEAHFKFFQTQGMVPEDYFASQGWEESPSDGGMDGDYFSDEDDDYCEEPAAKRPKGGATQRQEWEKQLRDKFPDGDDEGLKAEKQLAQVEISWRWCIFGQLEAALHGLANNYQVFAFNGEGFDLVILAGRLATLAKEQKLRKVAMNRDGGRVRWIKFGGIVLSEIKRLVSPGTSLAALAKTYNLEESKGIFPWDLFTSVSYLETKRLPADAASWVSALNPTHAPTQQEVDEVQRLYDSSGFECVGDYLRHYLSLDVVILLKAIISMENDYYQALGLDFVELRKTTVSSLSHCGAQHFLARNKRIGHFFPNHARMYSVSFLFFESCLFSP